MLSSSHEKATGHSTSRSKYHEIGTRAPEAKDITYLNVVQWVICMRRHDACCTAILRPEALQTYVLSRPNATAFAQRLGRNAGRRPAAQFSQDIILTRPVSVNIRLECICTYTRLRIHEDVDDGGVHVVMIDRGLVSTGIRWRSRLGESVLESRRSSASSLPPSRYAKRVMRIMHYDLSPFKKELSVEYWVFF